MTTKDMVTELRKMAAQCIDAPKGKSFFTKTADRLEDLDCIKNAGQPALEGSIPVVLYLSTQAEADELMREVHKAKPHMIARSLE